jgi:hypothetical protein
MSRGNSLAEGRYANHFELAFTESEFLLDFGQSYDREKEPLIHTRIILTPLSAKALFAMLHDLLEQYETKAGRIGVEKA